MGEPLLERVGGRFPPVWFASHPGTLVNCKIQFRPQFTSENETLAWSNLNLTNVNLSLESNSRFRNLCLHTPLSVIKNPNICLFPPRCQNGTKFVFTVFSLGGIVLLSCKEKSVQSCLSLSILIYKNVTDFLFPGRSGQYFQAALPFCEGIKGATFQVNRCSDFCERVLGVLFMFS